MYKRQAYALDYQIGGTLLSAQSIGYLGIGLLSGLAAIKWGLKRAYLILYYVCLLYTSIIRMDSAESSSTQ